MPVSDSVNIAFKQTIKLLARINDLLHFTEKFFEITPYLILWYNNKINYYDKDLGLYIRKLQKTETIRFVVLKLTILTSLNITHANVIIYDKINEIVEKTMLDLDENKDGKLSFEEFAKVM